nr:hypothetical protein [Tanacetum cinerariifolium]
PRSRPASTLPDPRSPNEKSALLPAFTPHHHRNSSSISDISAIEAENDMVELVAHNQSLLQRLSLGLGWLTPSGSANPPRKPSGNVLERGLRAASYAAIP